MSTAVTQVIHNPAHFVPANALVFGAVGEPPIAVTAADPLPVRDSGVGPSLIERLNREGEPFSTFGSASFASFAAPTGAGTVGPTGISAIPAGRAVFLQHVTFWSTTPIAARLWAGGSNWGAGVGTATQAMLDTGFACGPNYSASFPINVFLRSSDKPNFNMFIKQWLDPAVTGTHYVGAGATGFQLADSINFDARKVILFMGDSLWNGTGPSDVTKCIPWLVNRFYRERGVDCRYVLKAFSGSTTSGHETFRQGGRYDFPQVDAIFYSLGINDAAQAYSTATSMANIQALVAWKQKRYPSARLVILGPTPVQNNTYEAALAALRSAQQAFIAGLGDPRVLYCNLGNSFDRTVNDNYTGADTPGAALHPGDTGLVFEWDGGYSGNPGLKAWLGANLSTI